MFMKLPLWQQTKAVVHLGRKLGECLMHGSAIGGSAAGMQPRMHSNRTVAGNHNYGTKWRAVPGDDPERHAAGVPERQ
jgi:hypothetical protein